MGWNLGVGVRIDLTWLHRLSVVAVAVAMLLFRHMSVALGFGWNLTSIEINRVLVDTPSLALWPAGVTSLRGDMLPKEEIATLLQAINQFPAGYAAPIRDLRQAELLWLNGQVQIAIDKMSALQTHNPLVALELGNMLFQIRRDTEAARIWKYVEDESKSHVIEKTFVQYGDIAFKTNRFVDSARFFRMATMLAPEDFEAWRGLGDALIRQNMWQDAKGAYTHAISLAQSGQVVIEDAWKYGDTLVRTGEHLNGLKALRLVLDLNPYWEPAWVSSGNALMAQGQSRSAGEAYSKAIRLNPNSPNANVAYGEWLLLQDPDSTEAALFFENGVSLDRAGYNTYALDPGPWLYQKIIISFWSAGKLSDASVWAQRAIADFPTHPVPLYDAGLIAMKTKSYDESIAWFEEALAQDPKFPEAYEALAQVYSELGRNDLSRYYAEKGAQLRITP